MGVGVSAAEVSLESGYAQTKSRILNPTLTVFVGVYVFFGLNLWFAIQQTEFTSVIHIPIFIFQTLLGIVMFTPLHDAVHKAASPNPKINALILHGVWPIFLNAPFIFKLIHLAHHAHTNQGLDDPDHFTSAPTWKGRWIRSFLLIFSYYEYGLRKFPRTRENLTWIALSFGVLGAVSIGIWFTPWSIPLFMAWLLPSFVSIGFLAFLNTAWPHHPGHQTSRIKNTKILMVPKALEWLLLNQNYHLLHHLRPTMPWYDYKAYWAKHRDRLLAEGAEVVDYRSKLGL